MSTSKNPREMGGLFARPKKMSWRSQALKSLGRVLFTIFRIFSNAAIFPAHIPCERWVEETLSGRNKRTDGATMRKKQKRLLLALFSTAILSTSLTFVSLSQDKSESKEAEQAALAPDFRFSGYQFIKGRALTYKLEYSSRVDVNQNLFSKGLSLESEKVVVALDGVLKETVLDVSDRQAKIFMQFEGRLVLGEGEKTIALETKTHKLRDLKQGWLLTRNLEGSVVSISTVAESGTLIHGVMSHLSSLLQCSVPEDASASWERREEGSLGVSQTQYQAEGRSETIMIRRQRRFVKTNARGVSLSVPQDIRFVFASGNGYLQSASGIEEVIGDYEGRRCYRGVSRLTLSLVKLGFVTPESAPVLNAGQAELAKGHKGSLFAKIQSKGRAADLAATKGTSIEETLQLTESVDRQSIEENLKVLRRLAAFVRLDAKNAGLIEAALKDTGPGQDREDLILAALGAAGTPAAGEVLLRFATERADVSESLRSALPSLGQLTEPTEEVSAFLQDLYEQDNGSQEIQSMALLALGALAETAHNNDDSLGGTLSKYIEDQLSDQGADRRTVLLALGNAGQEESLSLIERELASDRPLEIRAVALDSLRKIKTERADLLLEQALGAKESELRYAAAMVYSARPLTAQSKARLESLAQSDPSKDLRIAALRAISVGIKTDGQSLAVFQFAAESDPDQDVRAYAKGFLLFVQKS